MTALSHETRQDPAVRPYGGEPMPNYLAELPCAREHETQVGRSAAGVHFKHGDHRMTLAEIGADPLAELKAFVERCHAYDEDEDER